MYSTVSRRVGEVAVLVPDSQVVKFRGQEGYIGGGEESLQGQGERSSLY